MWGKHARGGELPFPHVPATNLPDPATPLFQLVKNSCMEMMAGDTHFVRLGGESQVTDLDRSVCVCDVFMWHKSVVIAWGGICGVFVCDVIVYLLYVCFEWRVYSMCLWCT